MDISLNDAQKASQPGPRHHWDFSPLTHHRGSLLNTSHSSGQSSIHMDMNGHLRRLQKLFTLTFTIFLTKNCLTMHSEGGGKRLYA